MIQPVNAFTPKVLFRGDETISAADDPRRKTRRNLAIFNATGISVALGAATTAVARSNTSSWAHAGYIGIGAALISMMFLIPGFLYKAGINTSAKPLEKDIFSKEINSSKKFFAEASEISAAAKNTTKATLRSFPRI